MAKIEDSKKQICNIIMNMSAEVFYNFCFDIEYYKLNYGFEIFDCVKCNKEFECNNECYDYFMKYYEVDKYEVK